MAKATAEQKRELARLAGTSVGTLRQVAGAYKTNGELRCGPGLALRLEKASDGALKATDFCKELRGL